MEQQNNDAKKLTEKAFSRLIISSVLGILVCVMCLCSATWAWFSTDVSNDSNTLCSGNFGLIVTVTDENGTSVDVTENPDGTSVCAFADAKEYNVTLKMTEDTTVTKGFCVIKAGNASYSTAAMNSKEGITSLSFKIDVKEAGLTLSFTPAWGLPAEESVQAGGVLAIGNPSQVVDESNFGITE